MVLSLAMIKDQRYKWFFSGLKKKKKTKKFVLQKAFITYVFVEPVLFSYSSVRNTHPATALSFPRNTSHTWTQLYALVIYSPFPFLLSLLNPFNNILKNMDSYSQDAKYSRRGKKKQITNKSHKKGGERNRKIKLKKKFMTSWYVNFVSHSVTLKPLCPPPPTPLLLSTQ